MTPVERLSYSSSGGASVENDLQRPIGIVASDNDRGQDTMHPRPFDQREDASLDALEAVKRALAGLEFKRLKVAEAVVSDARDLAGE